MTRLYDPTRKKEATGTPQFSSERETCLGFFERWSEQDQIDFVEHLLSRMCHYQHGHINTYLKPMLQRDFISLLPSERFIYLAHILVSHNFCCNNPQFMRFKQIEPCSANRRSYLKGVGTSLSRAC